MLLPAVYPPAKSLEEDVQIPMEAEMEAEETKLSEPKTITEGDGDPEPGKPAETQAKGAPTPAALLGNSEMIMLVLTYLLFVSDVEFNVVMSSSSLS